jgi:RNA polymerase sigma-70 factor (ECF subfamily)
MQGESDRTKAFVRDLTENSRRIYGYIFALVPNWADCEEIFQETSTVLWSKYDEYRPGTNFRAWAFRIAYRKVLEFRKAAGKNVLRLSEPFLDAVDCASRGRDALWARRHQMLAECYGELPPADRQLIDLRYQPAASVKSVAERVNLSTDAIYKALNRIHDQLLECIESKLEDLP